MLLADLIKHPPPNVLRASRARATAPTPASVACTTSTMAHALGPTNSCAPSGQAELLTRTIEPEFPFEVPLAGARIRGRIDLLARVENGGEKEVALMDFKTTEDRPPDPVHQHQLRLYTEACRALGYRPTSLKIHDLRANLPAAQRVHDDDAKRQTFARHRRRGSRAFA